MTLSCVAGWFTQNENPRVESLPVTLKLSLSETGRPWRGPVGFPVAANWASNFFAASSACGNIVSDRQFVCLKLISSSSFRMIRMTRTHQLVSRSGPFAECACNSFGRPGTGCRLLKDLRCTRSGDVQLLRCKPSRLGWKRRHIILGVRREEVCRNEPFGGDGIGYLLALARRDFLPRTDCHCECDVLFSVV